MISEPSGTHEPVACPQHHLILVAVDESENSERAVAYLGRWAACSSEARVVLAHVVKEPSEDVVPDREERERRMEEGRAEAEALLSRVLKALESAGVTADRVTTTTLVCSPPDTIAGTLLEEKRGGGYDTLVLGRRGVSKREEYIFGSVTSSLVRDASDICVWVVA